MLLDEQRHQYMFDIPLAVLVLHGHLLGRLYSLLGLFRKAFLFHLPVSLPLLEFRAGGFELLLKLFHALHDA